MRITFKAERGRKTFRSGDDFKNSLHRCFFLRFYPPGLWSFFSCFLFSRILTRQRPNRYERDSGLGSWKLVGEYVLKRKERGESTERDLRSEAQLSKEGSKKA